MDFTGRNADQILSNGLFDHSSWHFFQARSWLDYAQRTQLPSAIHYAAFEMRYGIEYLLFELLVMVNQSLTAEQYEKCLRKPAAMKKMLNSLEPKYDHLMEFAEVMTSIDPSAPTLRFWKISELFEYWGIASEFLHFVGAQSETYRDVNWLIKAYARLNKTMEIIWDAVTKNVGMGIMRPSSMEPEVRAAWLEFSNGTLSKSDLKIRMHIAQPAFRLRRL